MGGCGVRHGPGLVAIGPAEPDLPFVFVTYRCPVQGDLGSAHMLSGQPDRCEAGNRPDAHVVDGRRRLRAHTIVVAPGEHHHVVASRHVDFAEGGLPPSIHAELLTSVQCDPA